MVPLGVGLALVVFMILGNVARLGLVTLRLSALWRESRDAKLAAGQGGPAPSHRRPASLAMSGLAGWRRRPSL